MVSVSGGCDSYPLWAACLVGSMAGPLYLTVANIMVRLRIDDPVDAVAVHCGSGTGTERAFAICSSLDSTLTGFQCC